jgi:preprotein translocase subunit SecF
MSNLCKELFFDVISPYKHSRVEDLVSDLTIDNSIERNIKCIALAIGNVFTNTLMLSIDLIKGTSITVHEKFQDYIQNRELEDSDEEEDDDGDDEKNDQESSEEIDRLETKEDEKHDNAQDNSSDDERDSYIKPAYKE